MAGSGGQNIGKITTNGKARSEDRHMHGGGACTYICTYG